MFVLKVRENCSVWLEKIYSRHVGSINLELLVIWCVAVSEINHHKVLSKVDCLEINTDYFYSTFMMEYVYVYIDCNCLYLPRHQQRRWP